MFQKTLTTTLALTALALSFAASTNAQTLETVRVRLPGGQLLSLDSDNWMSDRRVVVYKRYYYEPRERVYVVYNRDDQEDYNDHDKHHHRHHHSDKGHWCPPGQAKKGRC